MLLLHLVGCVYYLYQWRTVKQTSKNPHLILLKDSLTYDLWRFYRVFYKIAFDRLKKFSKQDIAHMVL